MKTIAIILGAGRSTRCGFDKVFHDDGFGPLINQTLQPFQNCKQVDEILLVLNSEQVAHFKTLKADFPKISDYCTGGKERFYSLQKALKKLNPPPDPLPCLGGGDFRVLVHNAANPHITTEDLTQSIKQSQTHPNLIFGYFSPNSIKKVAHGKVIDYLDRDEIFETQTPQISTLCRLQKAMTKWKESPGIIPRDEAELLNLIGEEIYVYECSVKNQKITYPEDFGSYRSGSDQGLIFEPGLGALFGVGEDSHQFAPHFDPAKPMALGGVPMPESQKTFKANSDGDVIIHSLCNALLNALGEKTFDTFATPMCQEGIIDSIKYLEKTLEMMGDVKLEQVRISLEGLIPRIAPNHAKIVNNLARILKIETSNIGLTYTTGEQLTAFGKGEGMRCTSYVLINTNPGSEEPGLK